MKGMRVALPVFLAILLLGPAQVMAAGFYIAEQGTSAMGQADAVVARSSDPSTVFYNPAGIINLEGTQAMSGTTLIAPQFRFTSRGTSLSGGASASLGSSDTVTDLDRERFFPSHLYVTHRINDRLGLGLGFFSHFGLATEWPQDWEGRYISYFVDIKTFFLNPNISFQFAPGLTVGAGIQYAYSTVELKNKVYLGSWGDADADLGVADGDGWGYNLGALVQLSRNNTLGLSYRSPVKIAYGGRINYTLPGDESSASCVAALPAAQEVFCPTIVAVLGDSSAKTEITMPPLLSIGLANGSIPRLTLELDLQWIGWSTFDQVNIDFDNPNSPNSVKNKNWNDVLAIRFGGEYHLTDRFALRAGYVYDPTPVPGETVDTLLPDSDRHDVSIGLGFTLKRIQADVAYLLVLFNDRNVNNQLDASTPLNPLATTNYNQSGKYETIVHLAGLSLTYRF